MFKRILPVTYSFFALITISCQAPVEDMVASMEEDLTEIRSQVAGFQNAIRAMDFAAAAEILSEDVVVMVPNQGNVVGRSAWNDWVASFGITAMTQYDIVIDDIDVQGKLAYARLTFSETFHVEGVAEAMSDEGKGVQIWRKDANGSWMVAVDCWNSSLPLPGPEGME